VPQRAAIKAAKSVLQNVTSLVLIEEMANIKALAIMARRIGEATTYVKNINNNNNNNKEIIK
jgi:hypothetical protein